MQKVFSMWRALSETGTVPKGRSSHSVAVIGRRIYVFGGENEPRVPIDNDLYSYDLDGNVWSTCAVEIDEVKPVARVGHATATVGDKMYVFGGRTAVTMGDGALSDMHCYDSASNTWREIKAAGEIPEARSYHSMTSWNDKIYLFGGCTKERKNDFFCFDTETSRWEQLPTYDVITPRGGPGLAAADNMLYVIAGFTGKEENDMFKYDIKTKEWFTVKPEPNLPPISVFGLVAVGKTLLLFGGEVSPSDKGHAGAGTYSDTVYMYDTTRPERGWRELSTQGEPPSPRGWLPAAAVADDEMVIFGGNSASNVRLHTGYRLSVKSL